MSFWMFLVVAPMCLFSFWIFSFSPSIFLVRLVVLQPSISVGEGRVKQVSKMGGNNGRY